MNVLQKMLRALRFKSPWMGVVDPSADVYAAAIIREGQTARTAGPSYLQHPVITPRGIQIALAAVYVESAFVMYANASDPDSLNYPHTALSTDSDSDGLFQQRGEWWGTVAERMNPALSAAMFYHHLALLNYNDLGTSPGTFAQDVQQSAFPDRYDQRFNDAVNLYNRLAGAVVTDPNRPDFNEYPKWSANNEDRAGVKVDLWLIHTEEGGSNADQLADFLISSEGSPNPVSYHYTISQAPDGGVTVVDVVNTDLASWSVGNSNDRAINLCFASSYAAWTRAQWLQQSKAIDVAAYLCVQDCVKYGIAPNVIPPPYNSDPPGVSDHRYCTQHLKDGNTHTDVGDNFPWDVFATAVGKYWADTNPTPAPVADPGFQSFISGATDRQLLEYIADQLGPGDPAWTSKGSTLRDKVWSL